jgi:putative oxidoreductase
MNPSASTISLMALLARVLLAVLFLPFGLEKITGYEGTVQYIASAHVPFPEVAAVIGMVAEILLPILLLVGWQTRWVALALGIYTLVLPFLFHIYWTAPPAQMYEMKINFYKDLGIAGGLFALVACGAGAWSMDARRAEDGMEVRRGKA